NEFTVTLDHLLEAALAPQHGALVSKFSDMGFFGHVGPPHGSHRSALACRSNRHAGALIHPVTSTSAGQFMSARMVGRAHAFSASSAAIRSRAAPLPALATWACLDGGHTGEEVQAAHRRCSPNSVLATDRSLVSA